jgi:hypothetical protein
MKKIFVTLLVLLSMMAAKATVLLMDSSNYPYANGLIATQGQWYVYYPSTPSNDCYVSNDVIIFNTTNKDSVASPSNGWVNPTEYNYASFELNVSQLPSSTNGGYFCEFQTNGDSVDFCHLFIDAIGTSVPGTYRLGIANYSTSFSASAPPINYPMDLATGVTYTVVILYDNNQSVGDNFTGSSLMVNPSESDYQNLAEGNIYSPHYGIGYVYNNDSTTSTQQDETEPTQIGFSPYVNGGISNVIVATTFAAVNITNPPVFGIQPQSQTNYSGNPTTFYAVASGVDVTYQWYSTNYGALIDNQGYAGGTSFVGSESNTLVVNDLTATDVYYCVASDAYGKTTNSLDATNDVITAPTAPFFNITAVHLTNNLFTDTGFTNAALGTGPLTYQWYFAPTNTPGVYGPLSGQTSPALSLYLADYTYYGSFYVVASNSISGGSIAYGPTNTIVIIPPLVATLSQLHNLMNSEISQIVINEGGTVPVNTNNVTVAGYVTSFQNMGSTYREWFMQDASGYGIEIYLPGYGTSNAPPIGSYIVASGPVAVYETGLQLTPASPAQAYITNAPVIPLAPVPGNAVFNQLATNALGTYEIVNSESLFSFTNVYLYASKTGGAIGTSTSAHLGGSTGQFDAGSYSEAYMFIGPYNATSNTHYLEIFQPTYNFGTNASAPGYASAFTGLTIPSHCYQLTGAYVDFDGSPEIEPSRPADYVTTLPAAPTVSIVKTNGGVALTWPYTQVGSTYSVQGTTNLPATWGTPASSTTAYPAYGLGYWPTNSTYTYIDTNAALSQFYLISSP